MHKIEAFWYKKVFISPSSNTCSNIFVFLFDSKNLGFLGGKINLKNISLTYNNDFFMQA